MSHANDRKGNYWTLAADCTPMFDNGNYKRRRIKRTPPYAARFSSVVENNQLSYLTAMAIITNARRCCSRSYAYDVNGRKPAISNAIGSFCRWNVIIRSDWTPFNYSEPLPSYNSAFFPAGTSGILSSETKPSIDIKPTNNNGPDVQHVEQHYMASTNKNLDMTLYANAGSSTMAALMPSYGSTAPWSLPTINSFSDHDSSSLYSSYNGTA
ncbi:hypothetical protein KIN20_001408 [Parelaphostrongylus tenuis]|uniref:Fork-head domain-containing protein n=1 Tax=Parelaphostrongylus tenuis TaxID=148309 RepID=A0AAD5MCI9_PARTN|nr:hypothetical protein KIN20_001408 [Parelaphostrongylus tenuis]